MGEGPLKGMKGGIFNIKLIFLERKTFYPPKFKRRRPTKKLVPYNRYG